MNYIKNIVFWGLIVLGSCTTVQNFQSGEEAFNNEQYDLAIKMLNKELDKSKDQKPNAKLYFLLAKSYEKLSLYDKAIIEAESCVAISEDGYCQEQYADLLFKLKEYDKAEKYYKEAGLLQGDPFKFRKKLVDLRVLQRWNERTEIHELIALDKINSQYNEYGIHPYGNGLFFTSDRKIESSEDKYDQTGFYDHNIFSLEQGSSPKSIGNSINGIDNEGSSSYSPETKTLVYTRCTTNFKSDSTNCQLYSAKLEDGEWINMGKLNFCSAQYNYTQAYLYNEGMSLIFASDHEDGWGGFDIYRTDKLEDGSWDEPIPFNRSVNTPGDEKFPFIINDTLFFSSDYHTGYGGLDIFKSYQLDNQRWTQATNLRHPINSEYDDFGYIRTEDLNQNRHIYICSSREGHDDIYEVKILPNPEPETEEVLPYPEIVLILKIVERLPSGELVPFQDADVELKLADQPIQSQKGSSKSTKEYKLEEDSNYSLSVESDSYFNQKTNVSTQEIVLIRGAADILLERTIVLEPIEIEKEIVLEDIYYDFDSWEIRDDARPSLNDLAQLMFNNPEINIELSSHTDCRGDNDYNQDLSQRRAESAREVLIENGIDENRIIATGYGESKLRIPCRCNRCTETEHQANRRTSFSVIGK